MTQDNGVVQCPADDCKKTFDNRQRFTKHVTEEHPPKDVIDTDNKTRKMPNRQKQKKEKRKKIDCEDCDFYRTFENMKNAKEAWGQHQDDTGHWPEIKEA